MPREIKWAVRAWVVFMAVALWAAASMLLSGCAVPRAWQTTDCYRVAGTNRWECIKK